MILYYIGHGSFDDNQYLLSLGDSLPDAPDTKYRFKHLHQAIKSEARNARKYFILDSCFSGAALRELMSESAVTKLVIDEVREGAKDDEPGKGTALLCAADSQNPARAPAEENYTMFSGAFLEALQRQEGSPDRLSLQQVRNRAYEIIKNKFRASAVRPEVHSPDQSQGDIAAIALLPVRNSAAMSLSRTATVGDEIHDAFDPATFAHDGSIYCVVISPECNPGELATPLCQHVRRAWENFSPQISVAVNQYRIGRRIGNALEAAEVRAPMWGDSRFVLAELPVARAFASPQSLTRAIEALCKAEVAVFDLTGFEPGIMFLLGVRSVARRGVTISSVGGEHTIGGELAVPFNLQLLNLSAHSDKQETKDAGMRPWDLIGKKIQSGFRELMNLPHYLDLPAYDSVRELGVESSAYKGIQYSERVLALCPFSQKYDKRNWRKFIDAELPGKLKQRILKAGGAVDVQPRLERLLDQSTPRLVAQTLFESIRLTDMCLIDWTHQRPNVMFEAGVRLATNPLGAVHIVEETEPGRFEVPSEWPAQQAGLTRLFAPIGYHCRAGDTAAFGDMITRFEDSLADNRRGQVGFVYRAVGQALDRGSQPAALPLVDELIRSANILASDDQETTGISPVLYHEVNKELVAEAQEAAAERRLAAWLFIDRRYTAQQIAAEPERREQFRLLSAQVRRWARTEGRQDLIIDIKVKSQAVLQATDQTKT